MISPPLPSAVNNAAACPGLFHLVDARDGALCRLRLPAGQLRAEQAEAIATAVERHAAGTIELTNRANLQLRGVRRDEARALWSLLDAVGLAPRTASADGVRNVLVSPSCGIDRAQASDCGPLAATLLDLLENTPRLHALSPKFSIQLDGGERTAVLDHPHDLWLSALATPTPQFAVGLAGCVGEQLVGAVAAENIPEFFLALCDLVLTHGEGVRLRDILQRMSRVDFARALPAHLLRALPSWQRPTADDFAHIGVQAQRQEGYVYIGAVPALGRIDALQLRALAHLANEHADGTLRLTPRQSVLLPNIAIDAAQHVAQALLALGFAVTPDDKRTRVIACSGSRGCARACADTKADAQSLIERFAGSTLSGVHVSGCQRSCATPAVAPFTLLAQAPDRYALYCRADALSFDGNRTHPFGELIADQLTLAGAAARIAATDAGALS